ncbi:MULTISPECIES: sporulation membrane protein YtaF [Thermoactinomyces]|jgi:putative sporulation protein YtaF|uniref:Sporulation membrane protein YtaF n=1 Tax=Thermoactinomyces daqus TaxID=1329516 RepID=A0A7W1X7N1_9BACL|nr:MULTISPECIES: sporulation membrane protein YtaF [Thermoactinomyces]MBA4541568.1 sporulation membrane protein YtaF [Thermoactinomyces daqus]MBH8597564.1 sporulation membrane protein YtaF [Thermoactinomyces sp. CICC 10523]MBH8606562.1 sporulation membrane protein YtaF [Thermoactinomyces sp. CICC 10521]
MWHIFSIIGIAFALSLDSFGAGTTYGMRKIRIPLLSTVIIAGCSGAVIYLSMVVGKWIAVWLAPAVTHFVGAFILILLGSYALYQGDKNKLEMKNGTGARQNPAIMEPKVWTIKIRQLGLVVQILKTPLAADLDNSGSISSSEALLLGAALSLDSFGAGLGVALAGFSPLPTAAVIMVMSAFFLRLGIWLGFSYAGRFNQRFVAYAPGLILIVLGLLRFF